MIQATETKGAHRTFFYLQNLARILFIVALNNLLHLGAEDRMQYAPRLLGPLDSYVLNTAFLLVLGCLLLLAFFNEKRLVRQTPNLASCILHYATSARYIIVAVIALIFALDLCGVLQNDVPPLSLAINAVIALFTFSCAFSLTLVHNKRVAQEKTSKQKLFSATLYNTFLIIALCGMGVSRYVKYASPDIVRAAKADMQAIYFYGNIHWNIQRYYSKHKHLPQDLTNLLKQRISECHGPFCKSAPPFFSYKKLDDQSYKVCLDVQTPLNARLRTENYVSEINKLPKGLICTTRTVRQRVNAGQRD